MKITLDGWFKRLAEQQHARWDQLDDSYKERSINFSITGYELKNLEEWTASHRDVCPKRFVSQTFKFTETGIGTAVTVVCMCGEEQNITDYESW